MSRSSRFRSVTRPYTGTRSSWVSGAVVSTSTNTVQRSSTCSDYVGRPVTDSNFSSRQRYGCIRVNGRFLSAYQQSLLRYSSFDNYPLVDGSGLENSLVVPSPPSGWALDLVARTNPSRPVVTPLTLLQDLVELPKMLVEAASILKNPRRLATPKGAASTYLGTLFGWMPLVDDIKTMLNLQSYIDKRCQELNKLFNSSSGLKRRVQLGDDHVTDSIEFTIAGQGSAVMTVPVSRTLRTRRWATIRWTPSGNVPYHPNDAQVNRLARQVVSGMTSEGLAKGLWDVIPWTWMINWFTNVGKYALAHSNTVPAKHSPPCYMVELSIDYALGIPRTVGIASNDTRLTSDMSFTWKNRTVSSSITPGCYLPFLDRSRLSVISALAIQRWKPFL